MTSSTLQTLIPIPVSVQSTGQTFTLTAATAISVQPDSPEVAAIGHFLADRLRPSTGYPIPVVETGNEPSEGISLTTVGADSSLGAEGYVLTITPQVVTLAAPSPAGLFRGVQTLRQLFPPAIEHSSVQSGPWTLPTATIRDTPRFAFRGVMLDVARHFFKTDDLKRYIDLLAYYKINYFHLHLSDDQGWRIAINALPRLTTYGSTTEVGGGPGGYYTQDDYREIVAYAARRYITIVPEIDIPGHTNAALAAYPELNCNGEAPALYIGVEVGFSTLCIGPEATYKFIDTVVGEVAALTPGPYFHLGGDESLSTPLSEYIPFIERAQAIVKAHGKQVIGWEEISQARLLPDSIVQYWKNDVVLKGVEQGAKVIMSPGSRAYMDMKYDASTALGAVWAGLIEVRDGYEWDPTTFMNGISESDVFGIEAALWTETLTNLDDIHYMTLPRLPGYAEIGWSPVSGRNWDEYRARLGAHGPRFVALGAHYYASPLVAWE